MNTVSNLVKTLKPQGRTRWTCHWEAVKAVDEEMERILLCLLKLLGDKDPMSSTEAKGLIISICDEEFPLGFNVLKLILSNTSGLSKFLQGKNIDVF